MSYTLCSASGHPQLDEWNTFINQIAPTYQIEPNLCKAHIEFESNGDPKAVGSSGRGLGLGQIDFGTYQDADGKWWYSSVHGRTDQIFDPETNIKIMCRDFLLPLKQAFAPNLAARIAGYNAGIEAVQQALSDNTPLTQVTFDPEYVRNVTRAFQWFDTQSGQVAA